jgi:hypothetical protein
MDSRVYLGKVLVSVAVFVTLLTVLLSYQVYAQVAGATLSGVISDNSGAVIPNTQISIRNVATGVVREVLSNASGFYTAPNLLPGTYDVTASATGFATAVQKGITLTVGGEQTLNLTLGVGKVTESVEVSAAPPAVQLASSTISANVDATTIRELPLNGRDWTQLATLEPGVISTRAQASTGSSSNRGNRGFGNQLSAGGHRPYENTYRVDGININDYSNGAPGSALGVNLGVDAIREFSILTTNYTAEYGRTSGAVINAINKSGVNQFHGGAYFFFRDKIFDARNFFDPGEIPPFRRAQFGASAGGPIVKDKTFIFGDFEAIRQNLSQTIVASVPSPAARQGNLSSGPVTPDPNVQKFLGLWPLPNGGLVGNGDTGIFNTSALQILKENYFTVRVDHKMSDKDSLAGSYFFDNAPQTQPDALANTINQVFTRRQMASVEETHIFGSQVVNSFRAGYSRVLGLVDQPVKATNPLAADPSLRTVPFEGFFAPLTTVTGLTDAVGLGGLSFFDHAWNSYQVYDDAFLVRGTHSLKFGFAFERMQYNLLGTFRPNGFFQFGSLAAFLTNRPTTFSVPDPTRSGETGSRQSLLGGYLQDDWRARANLTLNLGLRYEMTTLPAEAHDRYQVITNLFGGTVGPAKHLWASNATLTNFEPRIGFAWDPFRNGKTALRAGFGIFDLLPLPYTYTQYNSSSFPFIVQASPPPNTNLVGAFPNDAVRRVSFDVSQVRSRYVEQNPHRSYAMNWNLNIQREITPTWTAMIGYVGSRTLHASITGDDGNMVLPIATPAGLLWPCDPALKAQGRPCTHRGTRVDPNSGDIRPLFFDGAASYHALQTQLRKRMGHGFQAQASYTWSKCIDLGSTGTVGDVFLNSIRTLIFYDRSARRGPCDFNIEHNFVLSYLWDLPAPSSASAVAWLVRGWQAGGIFTASTGTPFTVRIGGDPLGQLNSNQSDVPSLLPGCNPYDRNFRNNPRGPFYLNPNCFTLPLVPAGFAEQCDPFGARVGRPIPGTCANLFGNSGRNQLTGPGLINFDFSLFKNTPIRRISETFNVQFRAEFFNIFNRANFQAPLRNNVLFDVNGLRLGSGGRLDSTATTSRQIQFGLKLIW